MGNPKEEILKMSVATQGALREHVREFWNEKSCGEVYALGRDQRERMEAHAKERYRLEPYHSSFAGFQSGQGKDVLEIGVGMGADHLEWAKSGPRSLSGIDLTDRAVTSPRSGWPCMGFDRISR